MKFHEITRRYIPHPGLSPAVIVFDTLEGDEQSANSFIWFAGGLLLGLLYLENVSGRIEA